MRKKIWALGLLVFFQASVALANQQVLLSFEEGVRQSDVIDQGFEAAIGREVQNITGDTLPQSRLQAIMDVLGAERNSLVLGYSRLTLPENNATLPDAQAPAASTTIALPSPETKEVNLTVKGTPSLGPLTEKKNTTPEAALPAPIMVVIPGADAENATADNTTRKTLLLDVRVDTAGVKARLRDLGVLFTLNAPLPYVLQIYGHQPEALEGLVRLQELSGLTPVSEGSADIPTLIVSWNGSWTGILTLGAWRLTQFGKSVDDVWLALWKEYFSRPGAMGRDESKLVILVSGWASSTGPQNFDNLMDSWTRDIESKTLVEIRMDDPGLSGVWEVRTRSRQALLERLKDATKAQGLSLDVR